MIEDLLDSEAQIKKNNISNQPPIDSNSKQTSLQILFHQYGTLVDIYKHHLDLVLKVNIFIYAITGAILSFYFSKSKIGVISYSLLFPSLINLCYGIFFFNASNRIQPLIDDMMAIAKALKLISWPDITFLRHSLRLSAFLFIVISIGLSCISLLN